MFNTSDSFNEVAYPRIDDNETFIFFLKRYNFLIEATGLHSKARSEMEKKIYKESLKHLLVPTELIRSYYGDEVTIYFEWMNFLLSIIISVLNYLIRVVTSTRNLKFSDLYNKQYLLYSWNLTFEWDIFNFHGYLGYSLCYCNQLFFIFFSIGNENAEVFTLSGIIMLLKIKKRT